MYFYLYYFSIMKTYEVCFSREKLERGKYIPTERVILEAVNLKQAFAEARKKYSNKYTEIDIYYIVELISFWVRKTRYNKFYYVDKKTGSLKGIKLIYDMTKGKYINNSSSIRELVKSREYKKVFKQLWNMTVRKRIAHTKGDFNHYKSLIEKYCIKNNLPGIASKINNSRIVDKTKLIRDEYKFDIKHHLSHQDTSGKTKGCGCVYCKALYFKTKYHDEMQEQENKIDLHKALHFSKRKVFDIPQGEYFKKITPTMPSARRRLVLIYSKLRKQFNEYSKIERKLKVDLQIPKVA